MSTKAYNEYKKNIERITGILKYRKDLQRRFGRKGAGNILNAFKTMKKHMDALIQDKDVTVTKQEKACVRGALKILLHVTIYQSITRFVRDLSTAFSKLAFNWNKQLGHSPDIAQNTQVLTRIVTSQKTLDDTIEVTKKLLDRLRQEMTRRPVAYELSRHYLESLDDDVKTK